MGTEIQYFNKHICDLKAIGNNWMYSIAVTVYIGNDLHNYYVGTKKNQQMLPKQNIMLRGVGCITQLNLN